MSEGLRVRRAPARTDAAAAADAGREAAAQPVAAGAAPTPAWAASAAGPALALGGVQLKPIIGEPDDAYEQEADAVAARVAVGLPAPGSSISRVGSAGPAAPAQLKSDEDVEDDLVQLKPDEDDVVQLESLDDEDDVVQLESLADEDDVVQLKSEDDETCSCGSSVGGCSCGSVQRSAGETATPGMQQAAATAIRSPGTGAPLPPTTRGTLESRMGVGLGGVQVHTGPAAEDASARLRARAFTHDNHIWLGRGESPNDVPLMAHEVTHVLQQGGVVRRQPADGLLMPEPPADLSAAERERLESVDARAGGAVEATTDLPVAEEHVGEAREAVDEPEEETRARAQDALIAELAQQPEPSPEIEELCERIRTAIREKRPPDEDSLVDADPQAMAAGAGRDLNESVEGDAERVQGEYDELNEQPEGTPEQEGQPMDEPPGPADMPAVAGDAATPDGVPAEDVSLDADVEAAGQRLDDAGMSTEPALLVESGPIADAREAEGELAEAAARDPQEVLAEQQALLANASADMAALTASAVGALQSTRGESTVSDRAQQIEMLGSEAEMRAHASAEAERIFTDAQTQVTALLDPLPGMAIQKWDAGVQVLSTRFEQHLARVKRWIEERHESRLAAAWDYFTGLPSWVTDNYDRAEQAFGDGVCDLIREISTEVNGVIMACEAIIDHARDETAAVFAALPAELQEWAAQEQASFGDRFDGLQQQAQQTRSDLTADLSQRASQAVQSVREQIHALREAAKGLLGRLADAVNAFLEDPAKFIIEGLLQLLGIAPSAFWAVVNRIGEAIESIADDPMNFVNNLMAALGQGFRQFFDNIGGHLLQGLMDWLFSGLGSVGVQLPSDMSVKSIVTFFLQLMGLTWPNIRQILARHIGEENVALIEKAWELISSLIEMGPEGLVEMIKEQLDPANLLSIVLDAAVDYLIEALIKAVTPRIIGLFNPAGAILQAIEAIYRVLNWIFTNAARIFSLIETVVNGVTDLIAGNISGMANAVEGALARLITPVIDFLAGYLGLGSLPEKIADVIRGLQTRVLAVVDRIIGFLAERAKALLRMLGIGPDADDDVDEEDPEKAEQVRVGLAAIETEEQRVVEHGKLSRDEAVGVAAAVKQAHPVFTVLEVVDGGDAWDYRWEASPGNTKKTPAKKEEVVLPVAVGDRVAVVHSTTGEEEEAIVDALDEAQQIVWFRVETGRRTRGSRFALPYQVVAEGVQVRKLTHGERLVPEEPYDRSRHYGSTPTAADRAFFGVSDDPTVVIDHDPPLVERYYTLDPTTGRPGFQMSPAERRASANNRDYMRVQPAPESLQQGGLMSAFSRGRRGKYGF